VLTSTKWGKPTRIYNRYRQEITPSLLQKQSKLTDFKDKDMGACLSDPVDAVCRTEIILLQQQVADFQQQLDAKNIESATYQKQLIENALNEKIEQASEELISLNGIVLKMQQAKEVIEESQSALGQAKDIISDATGCVAMTVGEFYTVTTLSLVCFYGKGKTFIDIVPANGEAYCLPSMLDYNHNMIGKTALLHKGDRVKFGGYHEVKCAYLVPLKK
jgi:hypothetical protein